MKRTLYFIPAMFALILVTCISTYAWFVGYFSVSNITDDDKLSTYVSYFKSGDGTKDSPYVIGNHIHLYNLAWLQDIGKFQDKAYYFELDSDIDMKELKRNETVSPIPPIGIDKYPFISNFNGNGHIIKNLWINTDFTDSNNFVTPSKTVLNEFTISSTGTINTKYTGMFGICGVESETNKKETISNFYLSKALIETKENTLSGLIAGFVDTNLNNIGVHNSYIKLGSGVSSITGFEKISYYTLVGSFNDGANGSRWVGMPSSNLGYGTSTNLKELYDKFGDVGVGKLSAYPFRNESDEIVLKSQNKKTVILSAGNKEVEVSDTQKASTKGNNLGYYVGSDIKGYKKTNQVNYTKFYYPNGDGDPIELTGDDAPGEDIIKYLTEVQTDAQGNEYKNGDYLIRLTGSSQLDVNEGGLTVVENARVGNWSGDLLIPRRVIWVAPIQAGKFKLVLMNVESKEKMGFRLYRLKRSTPKDYSTYFSDYSSVMEYNKLLQPGKAYYFEFEITEEDINAGYEFALSSGDGYKPYISYMDIGVDGDNARITTSTIGNIDFVYPTNDLETEFNTIDDTTLSNVGITISGVAQSEVLLHVLRTSETVKYYYKGTGMDISGFGIGSYSKEENDF